MSSLADAFPNADRERFASDNLVPGAVIQVFAIDTTPAKEKRLIVVGEAFDHISFACIYINSELNLNVFPTQELHDLNPKFIADERDYLEHDSHVDCTSLHTYKKSDLLLILKNDPTRLLGNLSDDDFIQVKKLISSARTIKASLKKTYGLFF